ncbi:MAG TPA: GNAT family N-acetyltransferase, partial [Opitutus sp.]|nr:GNAT family N-acetyltransferase [Opitutus sp.]
VRVATHSDLPAIVEIYNSIIPGRMVTADLEPVTVESRLPWFDAHDPARRPIWVAEENGTAIAWLSFDTYYPRAAYDGTAMIAIYVAEKKRGSGIGRMLLTRAIEHAPSLGLRVLLGYIFAHNDPSLRLFTKFGFERWAYLPGVTRLDGVDRDVVIMGKRVAP